MRWAAAVLTIGAVAQIGAISSTAGPQQSDGGAPGKTPLIAGGRVVESAASGSLAQQIRGVPGLAWVGYSINAIPGHRGCCYSINNGVCSTGCALEGGYFQGAACPANSNESPVYLEGERTANIMFRVDHGEVVKVRLFSPTCQIEIGDLTLHWITGVRSADSIAFLKTISPTDGMRVVSAIGAHADPAADAFLRETAESTSADRRDRERAAMLLASSRGASGMGIVLRLLKDDRDDKLRESLPGALAQAPDFAGTNSLMDVATTDKDRKVRERAFFWLGRSKDPKAQKFIEEILSK